MSIIPAFGSITVPLCVVCCERAAGIPTDIPAATCIPTGIVGGKIAFPCTDADAGRCGVCVCCIFGVVVVTRGTISIRKSYTSLSPTAACKSCFCRVLRRLRSVCLHARNERSLIISSHALLINTGASPEIINFVDFSFGGVAV